MVKRVVGYDDKGKEVFNREAREYDQSISKSVFGITIGDAVKAITVVAIGVMLYANQQRVNEQLMQSIKLVSDSSERNTAAITSMRDVLWNLNNYLSASTGKQFKDGVPR